MDLKTKSDPQINTATPQSIAISVLRVLRHSIYVIILPLRPNATCYYAMQDRPALLQECLDSGTGNFPDDVHPGDEAKMTAVFASISIVTQNE